MATIAVSMSRTLHESASRPVEALHTLALSAATLGLLGGLVARRPVWVNLSVSLILLLPPLRLATTVINSADAKPGQQAKAHSIKGVIACRKNRDPELAAAALRQTRGVKMLRLRVLKACHEVGIDLGQR